MTMPVVAMSNKRKLEDVEEEDQRKSILDISMNKLKLPPRRKVEPPLLRSVLIFNTLKNIEQQLKSEGVCVPALPPSTPPPLEALAHDSLDLEHIIPPCSTNHTSPVLADETLVLPACNGSEAENMDCSSALPAFVPQCSSSGSTSPAAETAVSIPQPNSFTESLLTDTSKFILDSLLGGNYSGQNPPSSSDVTPESLRCTGPSSDRSGENNTQTSESQQFQELENCKPGQLHSCYSSLISQHQHSDSPLHFITADCSSTGFDVFLPSVSPSMKLTQLNHEDLLHTLPTPDMSFGSPCSGLGSHGNQKTELLSDDLDHIMQILVSI